MRISFKDYGFFVPTDISGRTVVLSGQLIEKELTMAQAQHFNEDLGEEKGQVRPAEKAFRPGKVYELVADSVKVYR